MAGLYGPGQKPLGHPATTRLLDKIAADTRPGEHDDELLRLFGVEIAERTIRERNDDAVSRYLRRL